MEPNSIRHDWTIEELRQLYALPLPKLLRRAQDLHRAFHDPCELQLCKLVSVKTGGCSEDCKYCAQSSRYKTSVAPTPLMPVEDVLAIAKRAKADGATRMCLGAAWRQVRNSAQFERVLEMVRGIRNEGLEVCCTLGMLDDEQIARLKEAGLYAYNHNLDTSREHYKEIVTSHTYDDRLGTIARVAKAGVSVCCGGIVGLGEKEGDRLELLRTLATLDPHPESVPLNRLVTIPGTPLEQNKQTPVLELVRLIATARIIMPRATVRLSAGRLSMSDGEQALCFLAGANSIFVGDRLLTTANPELNRDAALLQQLGMRPRPAYKNDVSSPAFLSKRMEKKRTDGCLRTLPDRTAPLIDLASNDYLGLASSSELSEAIAQEYTRVVCEREGQRCVGSTGSRLLTGNDSLSEQVETELADFYEAESALLFSSGYVANSGLLACLATEEDAVLLDAHAHASLWDGTRLSRAKSYSFPHNDLNTLESRLRHARKKYRELFVVVESLYSVFGDRAPLETITALCERYGAWLVVDEAHAVGVLGRGGRGLVCDLPERSPIIARIATFGKAVGYHGAAILGSCQLTEYVVNHCRSFIYTTALPPHTLVGIETAHRMLPNLDTSRKRLAALQCHLQARCEAAGLTLPISGSAIQPIPIAGAEVVVAVSEELRSKGIDVRAMRHPTVQRGDECLRVCLHSFNNEGEIDQLVELLASMLPQEALCGS